MSIRDFVSKLDLHLDVTKRLTCPACGRKNTFSVTKTFEGVKWCCFSASCDTAGVAGSNLSLEEIEKYMNKREDTSVYNIPLHWIAATRHGPTMEYLKQYNVSDMYLEGLIDVRYDPKQNRHVFIAREGDKIVGAYGRSASGKAPKWLNYSTTDLPYVVSSGAKKIGCIVEDPVSAAAVCRFIDGIALLGTNLKDKYINTLAEYDRLIICLDKDAGQKALEMQRILGYYSKTDIILLERDLKYLTQVQIAAILGV